jgi:negative regulator of flagellin synthesis FlgM
MNMRIDPNQGAQRLPENENNVAGNPSAAGQSAASQSRTAAGNPLGEDQAQLSGAHAQVQALAAQVAQFPEVRQEKVSALKQVVADGSYQVSAKQVAGALFDHMAA